MVDKIIRFEVNIDEVEKINPLFSKAKIRVLYTGHNRNQSHFSKNAVESAIPSIFNIPIVGEYLEEKDNFGGHGGKIEITDKGVEYIQTTKPYGVVAESAEVYWENVTEVDGTINEYLIVDGAYLWTGRYSEIEDLLNKSYGQSMEIEVVNGDFAVIDGVKTFDIKEFNFSALCILGVEKDGEGHVEPAFESASISAYSLDREEFKTQFGQMVAELKFSLSDKGGKDNVDEKLELLAKYSLTEEDLKAKEIKLEEYSVEELEAKLQEITSDENKDFALTAKQLKEEIRAELYSELTEDEWGYKWRKYWYVDHNDDMVIAEDEENGGRLVGISYSTTNDVVSIDFDSKKRVKIVYETIEDETDLDFHLTSKDKVEYQINTKEKELESNFSAEKEKAVNDVKSEFKSLSEDYTKLEEEAKELRNFKESKLTAERAEKEEVLFESFSTELTEEEMKEIKDKSSEFSLDEIEEKLFVLVGKKKASFSKQPKKEKTSIKVEFEHQEQHVEDPYGGIFDKYVSK